MTDTESRTAVIETDTTAPSPSAAQTYPPSAEFAANANLTAEAYQRAAADPEAFWAEQANRLTWATPFGRVLDWSDAPHARWFADGTLNVAENCVDRHVAQGRGATVAIHWEGEPGDTRTITYAQLQTEVCKTANALLSLGLKAGDRVVIYLPMIPEAVYAMLACARLGLAHGVVFAGFSSHALASRIADAEARVVITADGQYRRGSAVPLKAAVDEAVAADESPVEHVLVVRRTGIDITWTDKDLWWNDLIDDQSDQHTPEAFPAEQPLFVLYTSGTTGKPKGIVHTSGGYLTQTAYTHHAVFDHKPGADVYWCTADIGWITGHSYIVYGPLANGATQVIYEGTPNTPHEGRHWEIIDKYKVSIYYTAPTLIRT
ncbi:MAG TPA: AMP-binding protein, partial [Mycobacterium sp.]